MSGSSYNISIFIVATAGFLQASLSKIQGLFKDF